MMFGESHPKARWYLSVHNPAHFPEYDWCWFDLSLGPFRLMLSSPGFIAIVEWKFRIVRILSDREGWRAMAKSLPDTWWLPYRPVL